MLIIDLFLRKKNYLFAMKFSLLFCAFLFFLTTAQTQAQTAKDFAEIWDKQHVSNLPPSNVRHADLRKYLDELKKTGIEVKEVGRSFGSRAIYQAEWGKGATKVFMWSQMHGDEPTATGALIDMLAFLQKNRDKSWVRELENAVTIRAVPMLNPDGAEIYQRRNLQFIDINRDARALETPEGRLLKKLRDEWQPDVGFNLHNQNALTTVGNTKNQATISLLAVSGDPEGKSNEGHRRSKRLCAVMISALENFIPGHIGRYDDEYNPRAFGDMISAWGTPVVLIETGALHKKDEMFLVKLNFVAYLAALKSLVDKSEQKADASLYDQLPFNNLGNLYSVIFRNANVINFSNTDAPFESDIAINAERRRAGQTAPTFVQDIGDLSDYAALDEYDAGDFYMAAKNGLIRVSSTGEFLFYKKTRKIDWSAKDLEKTFPPDAIFRNGKWTTGAGLLRKLN